MNESRSGQPSGKAPHPGRGPARRQAASRVPTTETEARFARVLATPPCAKSLHFMLHHLAPEQLSTGQTPGDQLTVDDSAAPAATGAPSWLGLVVPKRHAKRAVTRNLVRRLARASFTTRVKGDVVTSGSGASLPAGTLLALPAGDWVLRLRKPFDRTQFPSAASTALSAFIRTEFTELARRLAEPRPASAGSRRPRPA